MKKRLLLLLAFALALSLCAMATAQTLDPSSMSGDVEITADVSVAYYVKIPPSSTITFGDTSATIGDIELTGARIEPNHQVTVTITGVTTAGAGELSTTTNKKLAYTLKIGATATSTAAQATATNKAYFTANGKKPVYILITHAAWNAAPAGEYKGTLNFSVSYGAIP